MEPIGSCIGWGGRQWYNEAKRGGRRILREEPRTMARVPRTPLDRKIDYPTSDGRPIAETDWHRDLMTAVIAMLQMWYAKARRVYVSANLLLYYVPGNKRKHVSPDV